MSVSSPVRDKSYQFALDAIRLHRELIAGREFEISRQMVRAATSVGANIEEAAAAYSRRDFAAKMTIASKEAREAYYWLRLIRDSALAPEPATAQLITSADELIRLLTAIVKSTRSAPVDPSEPRPAAKSKNSKLKSQNSKLKP